MRRPLQAAGVVVLAQPLVYLIEPDPAERSRIAAALAGYSRNVVAFERAQDFLAHSSVELPACIVVALSLPDMCALDFVASAQRNVPIIVLGRVDDLSVAVGLIRAGAADVLDRPMDARRLRAAVRAATAPAA